MNCSQRDTELEAPRCMTPLSCRNMPELTRPPCVSVVLPTFNRLQYLPDTVASVFGQTLTDWELLIADDGSDADTRRYLAALEDGVRVRVLRLSHTGIPAAARNAAVREATGEYVAFLDSDDLWAPAKLQRQVESLRAHPACAWSYTGFDLINGAGAALAARPAPRGASGSGWIAEHLLAQRIVIATPSVMVRRETLASAGVFNEMLRVGEDYELWVRLALCNEADFIDEPLTLVRRHAAHSFDDVTCLESFLRALEIVRHSDVSDRQKALVDERRAMVCARLAYAHARKRDGGRTYRTLLHGIPFAWRYPRWWRQAAAALVRAWRPVTP